MRDMRFEVFMTVSMMLMVFWVLAPCSFLGQCQHFGLKTPYWPNFFPCFLSVIDPLPQPPFLLTPYNSSTSQLCHFSPEDGDSMFFQNVCIDLQNYTAPKPKKHQHHIRDICEDINISFLEYCTVKHLSIFSEGTMKNEQ
jgi:hypothetical protein